MKLPSIFQFKRSPVASASTAVAARNADPLSSAGLFEEQATDALVRLLTKMPDLDEVLRLAGIRREKLRVLLTDDEISQACETRCDALLATPMRLEPSEGEPATKLMELLSPVLHDAITSIFKARLFGYSVMEAVYDPVPKYNGAIGFKFLGEKPMEWFEPKSDGRLMYYPNDGTGGTTGVEVDQQLKFFLTRSRPTYALPYGDALLSRLYWPWFFRANGWKFWGKFLERFGTPLIVGKSTEPVKMVAALLMAHNNAVIGVGRDDSVESVGSPAGNTGQAFDLFENALVRRIQKVVLGQTLTSGTDGGSGNRALGQVHETVRMDKRNSDLTMTQLTMQKVADALCTINSWPRHIVVFADDVGLETDRAERDAKLYSQGVRFKDTYYQDNYDLNPEDFEMTSDTALPGTQPVPDPGAPPNPAGQKPGAKVGAKGGKDVKAGRLPLGFSTTGQAPKFTRNQQELEDQADVMLDKAGSPLSADAIRSAIVAATSPEDLEDRLFTLVADDVAREDFMEMLERALFAADVLGYVHAEGGA